MPPRREMFYLRALRPWRRDRGAARTRGRAEVSMAKGQMKKAKSNKPKLSIKEKQAKKAAKRAAKNK